MNSISTIGTPAITTELGVTSNMLPHNASPIRRMTNGEVPFRHQTIINEPVNRAFRTGV